TKCTQCTTDNCGAIYGRRQRERAAMSGKRRLLHMGMVGKDVLELQRKLNARRAHKIAEDEKFGKETFEAVKDFQRRNRLFVSGQVGEPTWNALNTLFGVVVIEAAPRSRPRRDNLDFRSPFERIIEDARQLNQLVDRGFNNLNRESGKESDASRQNSTTS